MKIMMKRKDNFFGEYDDGRTTPDLVTIPSKGCQLTNIINHVALR